MATAAQLNIAGEDWDSLVYAVTGGRCTLMLGPDAIECTYEGRRMPVLRAMARFLQRRLQQENAYVSADFESTAAIAQAVLNATTGKRETLVEWVAEFYNDHVIDDPVLEGLARLPFGLVVSTAPGLPVERAFEGIKPCSVGFYDCQGKRMPMLPEWSVEHPLVYHLFGSLDQPNSLVVSDSDQLDFMQSVITGNPALPENFTSVLVDPRRSFLFLGFRLHRWQLRILMHVLDNASPRRDRSLAFEVPAGSVDDGTRSFYSTGHGIDFFDVPVAEFVSELASRFGADGVANLAASPVAPGSPEVFICHASEDGGTANDLATRLRANGINTWLDKDDIRGGQQWDDLIDRTLKDRVGYVVVLQSANLAAKRDQRSYVNKEIKIALEVQDYYPPRRIFLIPLIIDDTRMLDEELDHLQSIDVTTDDGFDGLVSTIKRDIQRGQKQS